MKFKKVRLFEEIRVSEEARVFIEAQLFKEVMKIPDTAFAVSTSETGRNYFYEEFQKASEK